MDDTYRDTGNSWKLFSKPKKRFFCSSFSIILDLWWGLLDLIFIHAAHTPTKAVVEEDQKVTRK